MNVQFFLRKNGIYLVHKIISVHIVIVYNFCYECNTLLGEGYYTTRLGALFAVKRGALANVLGVGRQDVHFLHFGVRNRLEVAVWH